MKKELDSQQVLTTVLWNSCAEPSATSLNYDEPVLKSLSQGLPQRVRAKRWPASKGARIERNQKVVDCDAIDLKRSGNSLNYELRAQCPSTTEATASEVSKWSLRSESKALTRLTMLHGFKLTQTEGSAGWSQRFSESGRFPSFDMEEQLQGQLTDCVVREAEQNLGEGKTPGHATVSHCDVAVEIPSSASKVESKQDSSSWEDIHEQES